VTSVQILTPKELKAALSAEGFLVYRTLPTGVRIGERPRENLILDSGVSVLIGHQSLTLTAEVRSEASSAPNLAEEGHYERARSRGIGLLNVGFTLLGTHSTPVLDPGDRQSVLDVWYEVTYEKRDLSLRDLTASLHSLLAFPRR
jgi:hypothetical protein